MRQVATVSQTSKRRKWREILAAYLRERQMQILPERFNNWEFRTRQPVLSAFPSQASMDITDNLEKRAELLPPPNVQISNDINAMFSGYLNRMSKTKHSIMVRRFKASLMLWFGDYTQLYFPEDTNKLISSYNEYFRRGLAANQILIHSDLAYAGEVEEMDGVQWQKQGTKDHAVAECTADIRAVIPRLIQEAYQYILTI
jgi:hypothetical protein